MTHWKLERWHKQDVIPRPIVEHLGYGKGTRSVYPVQTSAQVLAVCRLLKSTRNFDVVKFQLWRARSLPHKISVTTFIPEAEKGSFGVNREPRKKEIVGSFPLSVSKTPSFTAP